MGHVVHTPQEKERIQVAEKAFHLNFHPERAGLYDAVLKPPKLGSDFRSLNQSGLHLRINTEWLNEGWRNRRDTCFAIKYDIVNEKCEFSPNSGLQPFDDLRFKDGPSAGLPAQSTLVINGVACDYRVYQMTTADNIKKKQWKIAVPGMGLVSDVNPDAGEEEEDVSVLMCSGKMCMILDPSALVRPQDDVEWTKLTDLDGHKPFEGPEDGTLAFPCEFNVDNRQVDVTQKNGLLVITLQEQSKRSRKRQTQNSELLNRDG